MKTLDRILQSWRIGKTRPYIQKGARVLDIGCADGALFRQIPGIAEGVGIDPDLEISSPPSGSPQKCEFIKGLFPKDLRDEQPFDAIVMLAVLEHVPAQHQAQLALDCARFLKPGGHLIITVPSPRVDTILGVLRFLRLIDGMSLEQHYGFDASQTPQIFSVGGLSMIKAARFQLGLNNLFVFQQQAGKAPVPAAGPQRLQGAAHG